ncbi:MAG: acetyltransferase [Lentisphaerae bacterium]|nr:acetyltransferase [Lentisphaerota bacterium]MBT4817742.1 acetyltransferase [Lentisphaerota bacterium]MBT5609308.1 acetyltransferase [Lentisphaerota bacterium]MBT7059398.1 acetyltransferase [Lentisphaerota bacterium]MBT7847782.1 acetyltransferase [Lentisphaerota bacterium]
MDLRSNRVIVASLCTLRRCAKLWPLLLLILLIPIIRTAARAASPKTLERRSKGKARRTKFRAFVREQFPAAFTLGEERFGWRSHGGTDWVALPDSLGPKAVVLIHGVDEPGKCWMSLAPELVRNGFPACEFRYPNDQPIRDSSAFLMTSLEELRTRGTEEIVIVAHSMGGLVSREMLTSPVLDYERWRNDASLPVVRALIMVGTPNHGSALAHFRFMAEFRDQWGLFIKGEGHLLNGLADGAGEAKYDLLPGSPFLTELNARPHPKGISLTVLAGIASPLTHDRLDKMAGTWTKTLPDSCRPMVTDLKDELLKLTGGIGDGAVALTSTRLEGVRDHVTVNGNHLSMIRNVTKRSTRVPPAVPVVLKRVQAIWPPTPQK